MIHDIAQRHMRRYVYNVERFTYRSMAQSLLPVRSQNSSVCPKNDVLPDLELLY
jgi:hypothetical protein